MSTTVMEQQAAPSQQVLQQPSVLTLLMSQQSELRPGMRLSFNQGLREDIRFTNTPYHYCGASGNFHLAAYLYSLGVPFDNDLAIATFSADGPESRTPWQKVLSNSPMDTARMAGHAKTAKILDLIHAGVPLHWTRKCHHLYPETFRRQAKQILEDLIKSSPLCSLPGSARVQIMDNLMTMLAHELVWNSLQSEVWEGQWQDVIGVAYEQAQQFPQQQDAAATQQPQAEQGDLPAFQFQLRERDQPPVSVTRVVVRTAVGLAVGLAAREVAESWGSQNSFINAAAFLMGALKPVSTTLLVGFSTIMQQRLRGHRH